MHVPDPETVKLWLHPGLWIDVDNRWHIDAETYLRALGQPVTPEECRKVEQAYIEAWRKRAKSVTIETVVHGDDESRN